MSRAQKQWRRRPGAGSIACRELLTLQKKTVSLPLSLTVSSRRHIKTSGKHETELLRLFSQEVRNCRDQSSPIIMCLWSANYLRQWQEGFCNTPLHYKDTGKVLELCGGGHSSARSPNSHKCSHTRSNRNDCGLRLPQRSQQINDN